MKKKTVYILIQRLTDSRLANTTTWHLQKKIKSLQIFKWQSPLKLAGYHTEQNEIFFSRTSLSTLQ